MPLVDVQAQFLVPCHFCDVIEIESTIGGFRRSSFDVQHRLFIGERVAVEAKETRVWVGRDPQTPAKAKSKPVPAEIIARFQTADGEAADRARPGGGALKPS
jgi:4-hydroxybenzoyl-CoA thioesterase